MDYTENQHIQIVAAELVEEARPLSSYNFNFDRHTCLVVGNEHSGIPSEIIKKAQVVYIEMPGSGFCLNTAQAANILLYEAVSQYEKKSHKGTRQTSYT